MGYDTTWSKVWGQFEGQTVGSSVQDMTINKVLTYEARGQKFDPCIYTLELRVILAILLFLSSNCGHWSWMTQVIFNWTTVMCVWALQLRGMATDMHLNSKGIPESNVWSLEIIWAYTSILNKFLGHYVWMLSCCNN